MSDSLTSWLQTMFATLYETSSNTLDSHLDQSFNSAFSSRAEFIVNHVPTTRDEFKKIIRERGFATTRTTIEWKDTIEVPEGGNAEEAAIVAGSFVVTRSLKFRIRAAPAQTNNHTVFSAKVVQDPSIAEGDKRRVVQIFITSLDKAAPIHLQGSTNA